MMPCKSDGYYLLVDFCLLTIKKPVRQATRMHTPSESVLNKISKSTVIIRGFFYLVSEP